jgi:hypothetical protein
METVMTIADRKILVCFVDASIPKLSQLNLVLETWGKDAS